MAPLSETIYSIEVLSTALLAVLLLIGGFMRYAAGPRTHASIERFRRRFWPTLDRHLGERVRPFVREKYPPQSPNPNSAEYVCSVACGRLELALALFRYGYRPNPVDLVHAIVRLLFASIALLGAGVAHVAVWRVAARVELGRGDGVAEDG